MDAPINQTQSGGLHAAIVLGVYRMGNYLHYRFKVPLIRELLQLIYYIVDSLLVKTLLNSEFPAQCRIGRNLRLPYGGKGIIIDRNAVIGDNVTLYHQVTISQITKGYGKEGAPVIGNNVVIGMGAKILGPVHVGDNARIEANSVVLRDVPEDAVAVGIPARIYFDFTPEEPEETAEAEAEAEVAAAKPAEAESPETVEQKTVAGEEQPE